MIYKNDTDGADAYSAAPPTIIEENSQSAYQSEKG